MACVLSTKGGTNDDGSLQEIQEGSSPSTSVFVNGYGTIWSPGLHMVFFSAVTYYYCNALNLVSVTKCFFFLKSNFHVIISNVKLNNAKMSTMFNYLLNNLNNLSNGFYRFSSDNISSFYLFS